MFNKEKRLDRMQKDVEFELKSREIKAKLKENMTVSKWTLTFTKKAVVIILLLTLIVNIMFFFYIVPRSGILTMTDSAMDACANVLLAWNAGTVLFLMTYMGKALFETKWEEDNKVKTVIENVTEKVKETIDDITEG